ncbi:parvin beta [Cricetulus griseus]
MSSAPPRSPTPRAPKMKKDESFLGKLGGTLARKKRTREVTDLQEEGKSAINSPMAPASVDIHPEDTQLEENEERTMIDPTSREDPKFKELIKVLLDWINDVLAEERIIVKQLEEDLYDGQVLQKLLEKLGHCKLNVAEVTQSEIGQKQKLQTVLEAVQDLLRPHGWPLRWNVDSIHGKNLVAILHLLVSLAMHFRAPIHLPEHVTVQVVVVRKREGLLHSSHISEELTTTTEMMMGRFERDAFDTLFDHAPDKLNLVKKSLITFVNKHLNKLNLEVTDLETQFADGVYLVLLLGLLEDYFVPLHNFYLTPDSFDQKVHNVAFAFELMLDGGLKKPKARPEDVVNLDLKSTLRVLYTLFTKAADEELSSGKDSTWRQSQSLGSPGKAREKMESEPLYNLLQLPKEVDQPTEEELPREKLAALKLEVEEISLTSASQRRKLGVILEAVNQSLQVEEQQAKWSVENSIVMSCLSLWSAEDTFDELFKLAPEKVHTVKEAIVSFVNQKVESLGLSVQSLDTQLHNVTLALELLKDEGLLNHPINPEGECMAAHCLDDLPEM